MSPSSQKDMSDEHRDKRFKAASEARGDEEDGGAIAHSSVDPAAAVAAEASSSDGAAPASKRRALRDRDGFRTNDEIHTNIDLCPVMKAVIDTPQVQRLRRLKQLGTSE